jgi:hypothetical protein
VLHPLFAIAHGVGSLRFAGRTWQNVGKTAATGRAPPVKTQLYQWGRAYAKGAANGIGGVATAMPMRAAVKAAGAFGTKKGAYAILGAAAPGAVAAERALTHAVRSGTKAYGQGKRGKALARSTARGTAKGLANDVNRVRRAVRDAPRTVRNGANVARARAGTMITYVKNGQRFLRRNPYYSMSPVRP